MTCTNTSISPSLLPLPFLPPFPLPHHSRHFPFPYPNITYLSLSIFSQYPSVPSSIQFHFLISFPNSVTPLDNYHFISYSLTFAHLFTSSLVPLPPLHSHPPSTLPPSTSYCPAHLPSRHLLGFPAPPQGC